MGELTGQQNGSQPYRETNRAASSTAIMRLSERMNDHGWLRDATDADLQPLVDQAWRELVVGAGAPVARKAIAYVMHTYRTPDLADPKAFVDAAAVALEDFPALVLAEMASPKTGIVRESKFPPSIAELVQWCNDRLAKHKLVAESGSLFLERRRRAAEAARHKLADAERRAKEKAEWDAAAPERERMAKEAEALSIKAAARHAEEMAAQRREAEARAAWTKAVFARFKDDAVFVERIFSLTDAEQEEATKLELQQPGSGSTYLIGKVLA